MTSPWRSLAVALLMTALSALPAAALTLRVTLQLPITAPFGQNLLLFKEMVEAESGGDITVEIYPNSQLFSDREVPTAVATGQIDMGVAFTNRFAGIIPAVELFSVPFLLDSLDLVAAATAPGSPVRAPLDAAMTERGMRPLWWQPYGFAVILSRDRPVRLPDDLRGMKIRTFGKAYEQLMSTLGGAATNVAASEQYLAYERGTVDGGMTGVMGVKDRKLYQVLDYLTDANLAAIQAVVLINERAWQRMDDGQRDIVSRAALAAEADIHARIAAVLEESFAAAREGGMTILTLDEAERSAWREATRPLLDRFREETGDLGRTVLDAALALRGEAAVD